MRRDRTFSILWRAPERPDDGMMGSRLRQALALLLVPVFTLGLLGGAYGFHRCPRHETLRHGGPGGVAGGAPVDAGDSGGLAEGVAAIIVSAPPGDDGGDAGAPSCTCVGSCHAGAAAAHAVPPVAGVPAAPGPLASEVRPERAVSPHRTPAYFLPYPLGPPGA